MTAACFSWTYFYMCVCAFVFVCVGMRTYWGQMIVSHSTELELQATVSHAMWVLEAKLGFTGRAASIFDHWVIFPALWLKNILKIIDYLLPSFLLLLILASIYFYFGYYLTIFCDFLSLNQFTTIKLFFLFYTKRLRIDQCMKEKGDTERQIVGEMSSG